MAQANSIPLDLIRQDSRASETQLRMATCLETVQQYADVLYDKKVFPPVKLINDGEGNYFICDGWHRVEAHRRAGKKAINAHILKPLPGHGEFQSAMLYALEANQKHGLKLKRGDQRKKARTALLIPELCAMRDYQLHGKIGVGRNTVARARTELVLEFRIPHPLTGYIIDECWPAEYASQTGFRGVNNSLPDGFEKVVAYMRYLDAREPGNWHIAFKEDGGEEWPEGLEHEWVVVHRGLFRHKTVCFNPEDNPIVRDRPKHHAPWQSPDETRRGLHATTEQVTRWTAEAAEKRLRKGAARGFLLSLKETAEQLSENRDDKFRQDMVTVMTYRLQLAGLTVSESPKETMENLASEPVGNPKEYAVEF